MTAGFAVESPHSGGGPDRDIGRFFEFIGELAASGVPSRRDGARRAAEVLAFHDSEILRVQYRPSKDVVAAVADDGMMTVGRDAAAHSRKHLKNTEIATRKMSEKLRDVQRTLNFEDQPPLAQAIQRLEDVRTDLLKQMFGKEKK